MSQSPVRFLWIALVAGVALWAWLRWSGEERRVHRRLAALADAIEKEPGESNLVAAAKTHSLAGLFSAAFRVEVAPEGLVLSDRGELQRVAFAYRDGRRRIGLSFHRRQTAIDAGGLGAETTAVALLTGEAGEREARRVRFLWTKEDGEWRIRELAVLEAVEADGFL